MSDWIISHNRFVPALLLVMAGCAPLQPMRAPAWTFDPPAALMPIPVVPSPAFRPASPWPQASPESRPVPTPIDLPPPSPAEPPAVSGPLLEGPRIIPPQGRLAARLELTVQAPEQAKVGDQVTFALVLENLGDEPADEVVIESDFDEAFVFPGRTEKRMRRTLGRLSPGESRELALTLIGEHPGRHCSRFTVTSDDREAVWKSVCVELVR